MGGFRIFQTLIILLRKVCRPYYRLSWLPFLMTICGTPW
jgi:hypothetical protein